MRISTKARSAISFFTRYPQSRKGIKSMRTKTRHVNLVALVAACGAVTTACSDLTTDEPLNPVEVVVTAQADDCMNDNPNPPEFCSGVTLKFVGWNQSEEKPSPDMVSPEIALTFDDEGQAVGSVVVADPSTFIASFTGLDASYMVQGSQGGFPIDEVFSFVRGKNEVTLVIDNDATGVPDPVYEDVQLLAAYQEEVLTDCSWTFPNQAHDTSTCVETDGQVACANLLVGPTFTGDVECNDETHGVLVRLGFEFYATEGQTNVFEIEVSPKGGTTNPPTTGHACVKAVNSEGPIEDEAGSCETTVDGNTVEADEDASGYCPDGALFVALDAKNSEVCITCGIETGCVNTEIAPSENPDDVTNITINVSDPDANMKGATCISVLDDQGQPLTGCTPVCTTCQTQPVASTPPSNSNVTCTGNHQYYYAGLWAMQYKFAALCPSGNGTVDATVVAGQETEYDIYTYSGVATGDFCSISHAWIVDKFDVPDPNTQAALFSAIGNTPYLNLELELGLGDTNNGCESSGITDWTQVSVVSLTSSNCSSLSDPNCRLAPAGLSGDPLIGGIHPHMLWTADMSGMTTNPPGLEIFTIGLEHSGVAQSFSIPFWVYHGNAVDL